MSNNPTSTIQAPEWLTPDAFGRQISVSGDTIRRWWSEGKIPGVRLPSGRLRIARATLNILLTSTGVSR